MNYIKYDQRTHVLQRPEMYIGSKTQTTKTEYVYECGKIVLKRVTIVPALMRIFIEILSNAIDNIERSESTIKMTRLDVEINPQFIKISNNGLGIPIELNEKEKIYNHTLIFGHLLTGSNYDDAQKRWTSGRNGLGAKLTNIYSKKFTVVGCDSKNGKKFTQTWRNNMSIEEKPIIKLTKCKSDQTIVEFEIDWNLFRMDGLDCDSLIYMSKLVFDVSMITGISVTLNGEKLPSKINTYFDEIYGKPTINLLKLKFENAQILVTSGDEYRDFSFVNGMRTMAGGKHVDAAVECVCRPIADKFSSKISIKDVKQKLVFLISVRVVNPEFESQEKNRLEKPILKFPNISSQQVNKILKWQCSDGQTIGQQFGFKEIEKDVKLLTKKIKEKSLVIDGYDKANNSPSSECVLIVCEGLSAKTFAVAGIEKGVFHKRGRDWFGIYPLRGKLLNVRNSTLPVITNNAIITNLIKILGLDYSKPSNFRDLKYGKILMITDADEDGIHIEGLILNFLRWSFPKLLERKFIFSMKTPIIKILTSSTAKFYFDSRSVPKNVKHSQVKYYKGLGTIKPTDVKDIFGLKILEIKLDDESDEILKMAFDKNQSDERKKWIQLYNPSDARFNIDDKPSFSEINLSEYIRAELVKFFYADCARTLPSVYDGLKESQRKIVFAAKKRNMTLEIKVAQLGAYVADTTCYKHGETNLIDSIIRMAQDFPGTNNIPLFCAEGMFGTRLEGGNDAAAARYIYTKPTPSFRALFLQQDDGIIPQKIEDGIEIEPEFYVPTLPLLLINGCTGIASGWMCNVPSFSVEDVIKNSRLAMNDKPLVEMIPWFKGFKGSVISLENGKFETQGIYVFDGTKIIVSELPIGLWNNKFKHQCEQDETILKIVDKSTTTTPYYELTTGSAFSIQEFEKRMKSLINTNNVVVLDEDGGVNKITINNVFEIWALKKRQIIEKRKKVLVNEMKNEISILEAKIKFFQLVKDKTIDITIEEDVIIEKLTRLNFQSEQINIVLNLNIKSLMKENREKMMQKLREKRDQLCLFEKKTILTIWEEDVKLFTSLL